MSPQEIHKDRGPTLLGVSWALTILATIFVGMRCYCRIAYSMKIWWDDVWMGITIFFSWAMSATWTAYTVAGGTRYDRPLNEPENVNVIRLNWISQPWCLAGLAIGKVAVGALILRLQAPCRWRSYLIWALCSIGVVWNGIQIILIFVQCRPISKVWNTAIQGHCWSVWIVVKNGVGVGAYTAFTDLALAAISVHMVWRLQMPFKRKIAICCLLSTGIFGFVIGVVKTIAIPGDLSLDSSEDYILNTVLLFIWNASEVNTVIVAGCVPTIMPLVERLRGRNPRGSRPATTIVTTTAAAVAGTPTTAPPPGLNPKTRRLPSVSTTRGSHPESRWSFRQWQNLNNAPSSRPLTSSNPNTEAECDLEMSDGIHVTRQFNVEGYQKEEGDMD